jgi:hypothetical protein
MAITKQEATTQTLEQRILRTPTGRWRHVLGLPYSKYTYHVPGLPGAHCVNCAYIHYVIIDDSGYVVNV